MEIELQNEEILCYVHSSYAVTLTEDEARRLYKDLIKALNDKSKKEEL